MYSLKRRVLLYTDCMVYGGSENLPRLLLQEFKNSSEFEFKLVFRESKLYTIGMKKSFPNFYEYSVQGIFLPDLSSFIYSLKSKLYIFIIFLKIINRIIHWSGLHAIYTSIRVLPILFGYKPNIVHINNGGYPGAASAHVVAIISKHLFGIPVIMHVNNLALKRNKRLDICFDFITNLSVDYFVTASLAASKKLNQLRKIPNHKLRKISNFIQEVGSENVQTEKETPSKAIKFISGGFLTKRKGFLTLIEATRILKTISDNFTVTIYGEGEEELFLKNKIIEYDLKNSIKIFNYSSNFREFLSVSDVLIVPSISHEDMPYVLVEAACVGMPAIGTSIAGIPEVIRHNETGFIVKPANPMELMKAMYMFILYPNLVCEMGVKARISYINYFSKNNFVKNFSSLYNSFFNIR